MKRTAEKYNLRKYIQLETTMQEAIWDETAAKWKLKLLQNGQIVEDEADFLINGAGFLK